MIVLLEGHRQSVAELRRRFGVRRLDVFGSASRADVEADRSDLDFIVQFGRTGYRGYADTFLDFAEALERLLDRKVDLLTERMIHNPHFRASVQATRQASYGG